MRVTEKIATVLTAPWRKRRIRLRRDRAQAAFEAAVAQLSPGDVCFDCGANVGEFTEKLAATGSTVYAFEPDPYAFGVMQDRFSGSTNVILVNAALGIKDGAVTLYRAADFETSPDRFSQRSSVIPEKINVETTNGIAVEQVDFFRYLQIAGGKIKIVKMDIEGAEVPILEKLFERNGPVGIEYLFVEMHEKQLPTMKERFAAIRVAAAKHDEIKSNLDWR